MSVNNLADWIVYTASVIAALGVLVGFLKRSLRKMFEPINEKIDKMDTRECRTFLVNFLDDVENGIEKDEVQFKLAYEIYDHYINDLKKNSYIHDKWNKVMNKKGQ